MKNFGFNIKERFLSNNQYDSPFFVIDKEAIQKRAEHFKKSFSIFPNIKFLYSYKTNALKDICLLLKNMGFGAEVVSGSELNCAINDGHTSENIFFDGPFKSADEIKYALENNITIQIDSFQEWEDIKNISKGNVKDIKIGVRLSHNYESGTLSRFGFTKEEFKQLQMQIKDAGCEISGVHLHVGSNILQIETYLSEIDRYLDVIRSVLQNCDKSMPWLDIGGGFPALSNREKKNIPDLTVWAARLLTHLISKNIDISKFQLVLEPGRHLVEDAGYLFSRVVTIKKRNNDSLLVLDTGLNHVRSFHGWNHELVPLLTINETDSSLFKVYGSNCYENDLFHPALHCPSKINVGDWFMITNVGGYDIPSIAPWIRPYPPIYLNDKESLKLIRPKSIELDTRFDFEK